VPHGLCFSTLPHRRGRVRLFFSLLPERVCVWTLSRARFSFLAASVCRDWHWRWRQHTLKPPRWRRPQPGLEAPPPAASPAAAGRRTTPLERRRRLLRVQPISRKTRADRGVARAWDGGGRRRRPAQGRSIDAPAPRWALPPPAATPPHRTESGCERRPPGAPLWPIEPNAP